MIIDAHAHSCGIYGDEQLIFENMKRQGIDRVILSAGQKGSIKNYNLPNLGQYIKSSKLMYFFNRIIRIIVNKTGAANFIDSENEKIANMAEKNPEYIMNTYWADLSNKNCIEKLKKFQLKHDFAMIKLHQCWNKFNIRDDNFIEIVKLAKEIEKPIFIHLISKEEIREFIRFSKKHKDTIFIMANLIGIEEFDNTINKNIYFDISCPELNSLEMLKRAYELVGAERLILGSDSPYGDNNINKAINKLRDLNMSVAEINMICSENIEKILCKKC
ncbi:MAG TPA: hypothetical protein DG753_05900 [Clostridium sp.]|nr:hypothetical protein [Clostridium sp.]